jgi:hypothetical protein
MMVDEVKFFAWLDGELPSDEAAQVEAEVARDPELALLAERHRAMQARLSRAFDPLLGESVAMPALEPVPADNRVVSLAAERERRRAPPLWTQMAALAATLALGVFAGNMMSGDPGSPIQPEAGRLVAAAALEDALYSRLASAPAEEGPRIGLTYRDSSGNICRTFTDSGASGLACREGGDWRIRGLFQAGEGQQADYRMAAGPDPRLMEMVDSTIEGEPFDAAAEKQAMERGWR